MAKIARAFRTALSLYLTIAALTCAAVAQSTEQPSGTSAALSSKQDAVEGSSQTYAFWPEATYNPSIPTLKEVVGHEHGERITSPEDAVKYMRALAAAAPDRLRVFPYATSWQGRELIYGVIGSPETIGQLEDIKEGMAALSDPRTTENDTADRFVEALPASVWIAYSVHGNEISPTDAGLMTAYHLLAAQDDPVAEDILANTVFFIDPIQNPDGRARFVSHFENARGVSPSGSPAAAERREPWPSGRMNHYLFDMNRDWFAQTQPETRGRVRIYQEWRPLVFVDAHEMGTDSEYFFAPGSPPFNPNFAPGHRDTLLIFGRNNAEWFDRFGFNYFTGEVYDEFFPGYGSSWPAFTGAIPMVYEQSSARGLAAERTDGTTYEYKDTVMRHYVASMATLQAASSNRKRLLRRFWDFHRTAIEEGQTEDTRSFIIPVAAAGAPLLAERLTRQGIEVGHADREFSACGQDFDPGTMVVDLAQPAKRLAKTLLEANTPMDEVFVTEQERRREKDLNTEIYDVTAWSLPLTMGIDAIACGENVDISSGFTMTASKTSARRNVTDTADPVAFIVPWGERPAIRFLTMAFEEGISVRSSDKPITVDDRQYPSGSLIVRTAANDDDISAFIRKAARETGADVVGVSSSWVEEGPSFGSRNSVLMPNPRIAMAWGAPTNPYTAGNMKFVIERQFGHPVTAIWADDLTHDALDAYDVIILPGASGRWGDWGTVAGDRTAASLSAWVKKGGTLVAIGGAVRWLSDPAIDLVAIRREDAITDEEGSDTSTTDSGGSAEGEDASETVPGTILTNADEARAAITPERESPDGSPGVLVGASVDTDHWLAAGLTETVTAPFLGDDIFTPISLDHGTNVARFTGPNEVVRSGYLWEQTKNQIAYKPFVVAQPMGRGTVIAFTQNPTFRAHFDGLNTLVANALFRGPAHSDKLRVN